MLDEEESGKEAAGAGTQTVPAHHPSTLSKNPGWWADTFALDHLGADGESILCRGALSHVGCGLAAEGDAIFIWPCPGGLLRKKGDQALASDQDHPQRPGWGLLLPLQGSPLEFLAQIAPSIT